MCVCVRVWLQCLCVSACVHLYLQCCSHTCCTIGNPARYASFDQALTYTEAENEHAAGTALQPLSRTLRGLSLQRLSCENMACLFNQASSKTGEYFAPANSSAARFLPPCILVGWREYKVFCRCCYEASVTGSRVRFPQHIPLAVNMMEIQFLLTHLSMSHPMCPSCSINLSRVELQESWTARGI